MKNELRMRAVEALQREFGDDWQTIVQSLGTENLRRRVGKELTSFIAFPDRGCGGSNIWRGNCSPKVVEAVAKYVMDAKRYYGKSISDFTLLDPMSGSGTSKFAADNLRIRSVLYDLNPDAPQGRGNWNALRDEVDESADLIFFHPPYHSMIAYSGNMWGKPHPDDLSRCGSYREFIEKLNFVLKKLYTLIMVIGMVPLNAFAWGTEGEVCSSKFGSAYVGYDGGKYYSASKIDFIAYDSNGNISKHTKAGGNARRKFTFTNAAGAEHTVYCVESGIDFTSSNNGYTSSSGSNSRYFQNLPKVAREGIMLTTVYGWQEGLNTPVGGTNNDD